MHIGEILLYPTTPVITPLKSTSSQQITVYKAYVYLKTCMRSEICELLQVLNLVYIWSFILPNCYEFGLRFQGSNFDRSCGRA